MDIPINVDVVCASELVGRSTSLILNPITEEITHIVVTENDYPYIERIVPVSEIFDTNSSIIQLRCRKSEFAKMEPFDETDFISSGEYESSIPYNAPFLVWPYERYDNGPIQFEHKNIPAGEIAIHRNTPVYAKDEKVGRVDEFLVDPKSNSITHLVLQEGHLWGKKDITIPVSEIDKIKDDAVYLKLDKDAVKDLPAVQTREMWKQR